MNLCFNVIQTFSFFHHNDGKRVFVSCDIGHLDISEVFVVVEMVHVPVLLLMLIVCGSVNVHLYSTV